MGSIIGAGQDLVNQLLPIVPATMDPARAAADRPCVLVAPPTIDYSARTNTWRLVCLSSHQTGSLAALDELDELLQAVVDVLNVDRAEPATYPLSADAGNVPAYVAYVTT